MNQLPFFYQLLSNIYFLHALMSQHNPFPLLYIIGSSALYHREQCSVS